MVSPPRRSIAYAQNFLRDPHLVERLLDSSGIGPGDLVVEIGPGTGIITAQLAARCRRVVAIEKDPAFARQLRRRFGRAPDVTIHEGDGRHVPLPTQPYKVFANVPFNATADIVRRLTEARRPPDDAYLAVQREAAQRFTGQPRESLCAVLLKPWFEPAIVHHFRRTDFIPVPSVEVVMLRLRKRGPPLVAPTDAAAFRDFVTYLFTAWKPTLRDALTTLLTHGQLRRIAALMPCTLDTPPTAVPFGQWLILFQHFDAVAPVRARQAIAGAHAHLRHQQAGLHKVHRTRLMA